MSEKDDVQPFHAKGTAPGQEAADVVAEVLAHAAEREKAAKERTAPKGPPRWTMPVTVNLGLLAMYFLFAQPQWIVMSPLQDPRDMIERMEVSRTAIWGLIQRIDIFNSSQGRLPQTLAELGISLADQGVVYTLTSDSTYRVTYLIEGEAVEFDSAKDTSTDFVGGALSLGGG